MALPTPAPGLVVAYSYLWLDQQRAGESEGRKDRPCVIVAVAPDADGDTLVYVAPITHSPPNDPTAVELRAPVKRRLGLDGAPSWVVTSELNRFIWPGYDLRSVSRDKPDVYAWGFLPVEVFAALKGNVALNQRSGRVSIVRRD